MVKSYFPNDTPEKLEARVADITRLAGMRAIQAGFVPTIIVDGMVYYAMPDGNNIEAYNGTRNTNAYLECHYAAILKLAIQIRHKLNNLNLNNEIDLSSISDRELLKLNASLRQKYPTQYDVLFDEGKL